MDARTNALRVLGLDGGAGPDEILAAYKARSRPLKRALLSARSADEKLQHRDALRELVVMRDMALGQSPPRDWRGEGLGISSIEIVEELEQIDLAGMDSLYARAFLEVSHGAEEAEVRDAFRLRARALTRRFAREEEDPEMERVRRAARRLRHVLHRALQPPKLPEEAPPAPRAGARAPSPEEHEIRVERVPAPDAPPSADPSREEVVLAESTPPDEAAASVEERWADQPPDLPASGETLGEAASFGERAEKGRPEGPVPAADSPQQARHALGVGHDADRAEVVYAYKTQARGLRVAALLAEGEEERTALIRDIRTLRRNRDLALKGLARD